MIRYNKIKNQGFTLIELLAVIVILAILALIAIPIVTKVIKDSQKNSFKESVNAALRAALLYETTQEDEVMTVNVSNLKLEGKELTGRLKKNGDIFIAVNVSNGEYCGNGKIGKIIVTEGECPPVANEPNLARNMIPIKWDGAKWVKADKYNEGNDWYNYDNKIWANAVTIIDASRNAYLGASVGKEILEEDIQTYMVWIPRYRYKLFNTDNKGVSEQEIEIIFEEESRTKSKGTSNGEYLTHPAFTFGNEELTGFWVGKFETTGSISNLTIKPSLKSVANQMVSDMFNASRSMSMSSNQYGYDASVDTHMMKNIEWGAVAYLSNSKYGINKEISINNSSDGVSGRSGGNVGGSTPINGSYTDQTSTIQHSWYGFYTYDDYLLNYNTHIKGVKVEGKGTSASTTGNIYGIYDMSGGLWEYVMGSKEDESGNFYPSSSGFTSAPERKYYDSYEHSTSNVTHNRGHLGDATRETLKYYGSASGGWYKDQANFINSTTSWFVRGGYNNNSEIAGIFNFHSVAGGKSISGSFRIVHK